MLEIGDLQNSVRGCFDRVFGNVCCLRKTLISRFLGKR